VRLIKLLILGGAAAYAYKRFLAGPGAGAAETAAAEPFSSEQLGGGGEPAGAGADAGERADAGGADAEAGGRSEAGGADAEAGERAGAAGAGDADAEPAAKDPRTQPTWLNPADAG
jgi:hypothetical protein